MAFWDDVVKGAGDLANGTVKAVGNGFNATTKAVGDVAGSAGKEIDKVVNGAKGKFDAKPEEVAMQVLEQVSKLPVVKVDRNQFLMDKFGKGLSQEEVGKLLADGPVNIVSKDKLDKAAKACIMDNVLLSSGASVLAGLPGGIAMAVTIPADVAQYYAMALKLAQELGYIYGFQYLWSEKDKLTEEAQNTLLLYLGVMLGCLWNRCVTESWRHGDWKTGTQVNSTKSFNENLVLSNFEKSIKGFRYQSYKGNIC